ncbi:50S ribosomal protein L21 [Leptobacterium flavescens]|uniref:Large ribosomal subunit protein bL21 n=1 Tax=Leptobacterium flavescens TaxID=472055 RepID=A0A6P0URE5_9FLAO|nr:50S ribosomal protein L21 [Leptobacterium flavescens]NER14538.1 50S ribosomal protein L21 [Leptobacterium flavescens]
MYAIVEIAGQQFKVAKDQKVFVHRLATEEGKKVTFDNVLLLDDNGKVTVGAPAIDGAAVEAKVVKHLKGDKVIVFKKKRRKGYRVKNGHRQSLTEITIEGILASGAKKSAAKPKAEKAAPKKEEAKKETKAKAAAPKAKAEAPKKAAPKKAAAATEDLSKKTVAELKEMAKSKGIEGISSMKKADLIAALSK